MAVIKVPKTPRKAFNPQRTASGLIQGQIQHLEAAAGIFPKRKQARPKQRTEAQSAEYIAQLMARIRERAGAAAGPEVAVHQPAPPIAGTPTEASTKSARTAAPRPRARTSGRKAKRRPSSARARSRRG